MGAPTGSSLIETTASGALTTSDEGPLACNALGLALENPLACVGAVGGGPLTPALGAPGGPPMLGPPTMGPPTLGPPTTFVSSLIGGPPEAGVGAPENSSGEAEDAVATALSPEGPLLRGAPLQVGSPVKREAPGGGPKQRQRHRGPKPTAPAAGASAAAAAAAAAASPVHPKETATKKETLQLPQQLLQLSPSPPLSPCCYVEPLPSTFLQSLGGYWGPRRGYRVQGPLCVWQSSLEAP
ncbi:hypothetical protein EPH_0046820 [Eimeria praecox]|uniref:Uncharacterized protein n=1 Tax=Eimeria praecox TaxID=51316 RepID=U6G9Q3_9EIME|nr:hypothetical protein EPH_0046820 [Eimeria praecox]